MEIFAKHFLYIHLYWVKLITLGEEYYTGYTTAGILAVLVVFLVVLLIYAKLTTGKCKSNIRLHGKTTIITGANTGIGYETALDFAQRGAKVILACRNEKLGNEAKERIIKKTDNTNVFFQQLDLSSFKSVRQFAEEINKSEDRLDILVNNAGAVGLPNKTTDDGLLLMMQTNYFGPVLLTMLLLDLMKKTSNSRIVNVSSVLAKFAGDLNINNLNYFPDNGMLKDTKIYARTKLCNILFTIKLAEILKGTSVTTYSLHPGTVATELARNNKSFFAPVLTMLILPFLKNPRQGAETTIYCSIAEGIENLSGQNFHDCHLEKRYKTARDLDVADKLWKITGNLLNLNSIK